MSTVDVDQWLEQWMEEHVTAAGRAARKADMHDEAKACAEAAQRAGISIAELKEAADGDVETYLLKRHKVQADRGGGPA